MDHEPALQRVLLVLHEPGNLGENNSGKGCNENGSNPDPWGELLGVRVFCVRSPQCEGNPGLSLVTCQGDAKGTIPV